MTWKVMGIPEPGLPTPNPSQERNKLTSQVEIFRPGRLNKFFRYIPLLGGVRAMSST